jgi:hypothetical protein
MSTIAEEVALFPLRNINAARRRVAVAREKAQRFPSEANLLAVTELAAGLERREGVGV